MVVVRRETPDHEAAIRGLHEAAFEGATEATVVERLRAECDEYLSFVAVEEGVVIGHIVFTPVTLEGARSGGMGLGPMAVLPSRQREGIGSILVRHGIAELRDSGCPFVIVLGHPEYYPRFGFERASRWAIRSQWEGVPDEVFMLLLLDRDALPGGGGTAWYRREFIDAL